MNMFKPKSAKNVTDYIDQITEPRKSEIQKVHNFIVKTLPSMNIKTFHNIIGYGTYNYQSKSGSQGEWFTIGLASNKNYISIHVCSVNSEGEYIAEKHKDWFKKANIGKSCIRFKKTDDINFEKLKDILLLAKNTGPMNAKG